MNPYEVMGIVLIALLGLPAAGYALLYVVWLVGRVIATSDQTIGHGWDELEN